MMVSRNAYACLRYTFVSRKCDPFPKGRLLSTRCALFFFFCSSNTNSIRHEQKTFIFPTLLRQSSGIQNVRWFEVCVPSWGIDWEAEAQNHEQSSLFSLRNFNLAGKNCFVSYSNISYQFIKLSNIPSAVRNFSWVIFYFLFSTSEQFFVCCVCTRAILKLAGNHL